MSVSDTIVVGKFGAPYGIKGWLKITTYTDEPTAIFDYRPWLVKQQGQVQQVEVQQWRFHNSAIVAKLAGVDDRNAVEGLKNLEIEVDSSLLPDLSDDEFYWRELVNMEVVNEQGYHLGKVEELFETGANDVMRVKANSNDAFGKSERLIPFVMDDCVKSVSRENKMITVDWEPDF